jgi:hypothetical protein
VSLPAHRDGRKNKAQHAAAEANARARHPVRPPCFDGFNFPVPVEGLGNEVMRAVSVQAMPVREIVMHEP